MGAAGVAATGAGIAVLGAAAAVAAVAVGAGLALAGMYALVEGAVAARDRLEEVGAASRIPPEASEALDQYQGATARLWQEVDVLTVQLGAALAPALTALADVVGDLIEWVNNLDKSFDALREGIDAAIEMLPEWARWQPAIDLVKGAVDSLEESYEQLVETADGAKLAPTAAEVGRWRELRLEREKIDSEDAAARRAELLTALEAELAAQAELVDLQQYVADNIEEWVWESKKEAYKNELEAIEAINDAIIRRRVEEDKTTRVVGFASGERGDLLAKELEYVSDAFAAVSDGVTSLTQQVIDQYTERLQAGDEISAREVERARTAIAIQKATQLASLTASAVVTWFNMTRDLSLIPGNAVGAPFEAAAIVAASMIGPAAQILGQTIPFPPGSQGQGTGGEPGVAPTSVGPAPDQNPNVRDEGYGSAPGVVGSGKSSRTSYSGSGEVTLAVTFTDGRIGKRRII
jgi:hypothetical protein